MLGKAGQELTVTAPGDGETAGSILLWCFPVDHGCGYGIYDSAFCQ